MDAWIARFFLGVLLSLATPVECLMAATAPDPAREGYVETPDGVRLYYQVRGSGRDRLRRHGST